MTDNAAYAVPPHTGRGLSVSIASELDRLDAGHRPRILSGFSLAGPAMVGVIRVPADGLEGFWELHEGGDELLVVMAGRMTARIRPLVGAEQMLEAGPGDAILIPSGAAHGFRLHTPEVSLLFLTPMSGNSAWNDDPEVPLPPG